MNESMLRFDKSNPVYYGGGMTYRNEGGTPVFNKIPPASFMRKEIEKHKNVRRKMDRTMQFLRERYPDAWKELSSQEYAMTQAQVEAYVIAKNAAGSIQSSIAGMFREYMLINEYVAEFPELEFILHVQPEVLLQGQGKNPFL